MNFGTKLQFTCPDECPADCLFKDDIVNFGQNATCGRCPVFVCKEPETEEDKYYMPMVRASNFRDDWAEDWQNFFKTGERPKLKL